MNHNYKKSGSYKGHFFEVEFSSNISYSVDGSLNYQITAEYFIDSKKVRFKDINKTINRFYTTEENHSDLIAMQGIDAIKDFIDNEIEYLKEMFDLELTEEIKI